jgi:hypothetical protein
MMENELSRAEYQRPKRAAALCRRHQPRNFVEVTNIRGSRTWVSVLPSGEIAFATSLPNRKFL